jgi:hypothetical protein
MKQAIVDKNAAVSSAALVSSLHLSRYVGRGVSFTSAVNDFFRSWILLIHPGLGSASKTGMN